MKAIILNQPKDFSIKEIDKPQIKDDEVLIRVKASGICTNDVRDFNGDCNYSYPRIGGHEYGGVIEEIGAAVNKAHFKKVIKLFHISLMIVKNVIIANMEMKISVNIMPIVISSIIQKDCQDTVDLVNLSLQKQMICLYMPKIHHLKNGIYRAGSMCDQQY